VAQLARLRSGLLIVNTHLSTPGGRAADPRARARDELSRLWRLVLTEAGAGPLVLGGDLNLFDPELPDPGPGPDPDPDWAAAGHAVDHVIARKCGAVLATTTPGRAARTADGRTVDLSDHEPLIVELDADAR
jgi:endonuclease/exonuclease/phosphatase family metal-dependent hydrolase